MRGNGGGPKTVRGKAASSRYAVRHGLCGGAPVIPGMESFDAWERHRKGIIASFEPEGAFETFLAGRIASLSWRLYRVPRYETEMAAGRAVVRRNPIKHGVLALRQPRRPGRSGQTPTPVIPLVERKEQL